MGWGNWRQVVLGQVSRRHTGGGVLAEDFLKERRHAAGRFGGGRFDQGRFAGVRIDEMDLTQVPGGVTDVGPGEVAIAGGYFKRKR